MVESERHLSTVIHMQSPKGDVAEPQIATLLRLYGRQPGQHSYIHIQRCLSRPYPRTTRISLLSWYRNTLLRLMPYRSPMTALFLVNLLDHQFPSVFCLRRKTLTMKWICLQEQKISRGSMRRSGRLLVKIWRTDRRCLEAKS